MAVPQVKEAVQDDDGDRDVEWHAKVFLQDRNDAHIIKPWI
jgi:hypothetical protein